MKFLWHISAGKPVVYHPENAEVDLSLCDILLFSGLFSLRQRKLTYNDYAKAALASLSKFLLIIDIFIIITDW